MENPKELIRAMDFKSNVDRKKIIIDRLRKMNIGFVEQKYLTGSNLIVDLGIGSQKIGVGAHFDKVHHSGGANDNGSAIAVCFDIINKFIKSGIEDLGIRLFFFDEEETGLHGSKAYINEYGTKDLIGLINMELVGIGDKFAVWPTNTDSKGAVLEVFESVAKDRRIATKRFDKIVTNTADHLSFQKAGLTDSFTITCISDQDLEVSYNYYNALEQGATDDELFAILSRAPIFQHYHQPTDTFEKIQVESLVMTSATIWETIQMLQAKR